MADDEDREAEGDMIGLGSKVTPEKINFMTKHARVLLCTSIGREIAERLELPQMWQEARQHGPVWDGLYRQR